LILGGGNARLLLVGSYKALHAAEEEPDWVTGTSIGAVTANLQPEARYYAQADERTVVA
jgi:predicted acylesterase/phospholipase RssA